MKNNEPSAICNVLLNGKYKKIASNSTIIEDTDSCKFDFIIEYPANMYTAFTLQIKFENDNEPCRSIYYIDNEDTSVITMINYNMVNDTNYTMFANIQKVLTVADKHFYIKPKIVVYNNIKEVYVDLYSY